MRLAKIELEKILTGISILTVRSYNRKMLTCYMYMYMYSALYE